MVIGTEAERIAALNRPAHIYFINREKVDWLISKSGIPFDFDMVVIDELSSFKSYSAKRFKSLLKVRPRIKRMVGLTGTPSSNGLMDLWAEFRIMDKMCIRDRQVIQSVGNNDQQNKNGEGIWMARIKTLSLDLSLIHI